MHTLLRDGVVIDGTPTQVQIRENAANVIDDEADDVTVTENDILWSSIKQIIDKKAPSGRYGQHAKY